ncbi:MAG: HAMP domain-containing sensor histidine kinase [Bacteroidota bacterium]
MKKISNIYLAPFFSFLLITIIGLLDYNTGKEVSFLIFYLIPIVLIALHKNCKNHIIIINAFFAATIWFLSSLSTHKFYSNPAILYWNSLVRFLIFLVVGLLVYALKKTKEQLLIIKELNEEKNKYLGIAAHDLRSPVSGIFSLSELILNDEAAYPVNSETKKIIELIQQTSNSSLTLLNNFLDFSKIEAGKLHLELKSNNYISFIKKCIVVNHLFAQKKNIEIIIESEMSALYMHFDENYLLEVMNNLLMNAIKFSYPNSKIKIKISVVNNFVKTEIIDQGVGILKEEQSKLFDFFTKSSSKATDGEVGSGIGLAIVKKIVLDHNGEVGVTSEQYKGSNFYFLLPVSQINSASEKEIS